jgi:outer membrane autotransporter protein
LDKVFSGRVAAGLGIGYTGDKVDVSGASSDLRSQSYSLALYGAYALSAAVYIDAMLGYSYLKMDSDRQTASGAHATGTRNANAVFGSVTSGYIYRAGAFTLSPYGRAQASWAGLERYDESGAGWENLTYGSTNIRMFALAAGVEGGYTFEHAWGSLIPRLNAQYLHNFDDNAAMNIGYADLGTTPYSFSGNVYAKDNITLGAGLDAAFNSNWSISGDYKMTIGDHLRDNRLSLMLNYAF